MAWHANKGLFRRYWGAFFLHRENSGKLWPYFSRRPDICRFYSLPRKITPKNTSILQVAGELAKITPFCSVIFCDAIISAVAKNLVHTKRESKQLELL
ncbi:hypothetical protein [Paenibacillus sp. TH7-28]